MSRCVGRQGAKPTPQLPISAVVTPFQEDGVMLAAPGRLRVVMRVNVDEARRDQLAARVDLLRAGLGRDVADLGDAAIA